GPEAAGRPAAPAGAPEPPAAMAAKTRIPATAAPAAPRRIPLRRSGFFSPGSSGTLGSSLRTGAAGSGSGSHPIATGTAVRSSVDCRGSVFHQSDRKSTRLNSSHVKISYAVFCLIKNYGDEHHELAGRAKDMGSAAV